MDTYVTPAWDFNGNYHYIVYHNGSVYDEFTSKGWLTHSQMVDVARGYEEALSNYL